MRRSLPVLLAILLALIPQGHAEAALKISGESIWKLGYGSRYYSAFGWKLGLGGFIASQELRLDVTGEIIEGLKLDAHIDNTRGDMLQQLTVSLDWNGFRAGGGSIQLAPMNRELGLPRATVFGLYVGYESDIFSVRAQGGRAQGVRASKTFRGATAADVIDYIPDGPYFPQREGAKLNSALEGLWNAAGAEEFDPAFDVAGALFLESSASGQLEAFLEANSLGFLVKSALNPDGTLVPGGFNASTAVDGLSGVSGAYIMLKSEPRVVVRSLLTELIRAYNDALGLIGDAQGKYPYISGSATDMQFLDELLEGWTSFATASRATGVIVSAIPFGDFGRGILYPLGFTGIIAESMSVTAVSRSGVRMPLNSVPGANWLCYEDRGYLEMTLPSDFTDQYSYVTASFSYRLAQGLYFLGGGIVRGSVTARLDGRALSEGTDFEVDYETGILLLMEPIPDGAEGELAVEFEYQASGSKAWIASVGAEYEPVDGLKLGIEYSYASDAPYLAQDEATVSRERSYDNLVSAWAEWSAGKGFSLSAGASFGASAFPGAMAQRPNAYNLIGEVEALLDSDGGKWWAFMHLGGVSVLSPYGSGWRKLKLPASMAGAQVNGACSYSGVWYFATSAGIAMLDADYAAYGEDFSDISSLWKAASTRDGLPSSSIRAVSVYGGALYAATPAGLAEGSLDMEGEWRLYRPSSHAEMEGALLDLAVHPSGLIVASEGKVAAFDGLSFFEVLGRGALSAEAADMDEAQSVLLATDTGFAIIGSGLAVEEFTLSEQPEGLCGFGSFVVLAGRSGIAAFDVSTEASVLLYDGPAASVATDGTELYAGCPADAGYEMPVVRLDFPLGEPDVITWDVHGMDGRDLRHFLELDPSENTLYGAAGYARASYSSEKFDASATLRARGAGSVAGAGPGKPDTASLALQLSWRPASSLAVSLLESVDAAGLFGYLAGDKALMLSNTLQAGFNWDGPLKLGLLATYGISRGFGEGSPPLSQAVSGSVSLQYSYGPIRLAGSLSAALRAAEGFDSYAYSAAGASAYLQAGRNTLITASYTEPTPFGGLLAPSGNYRSLSASIRYSAYMTYGSLSLNAKGGYKWDVRNVSDSADASAGLVYSARPISMLGASFIPRTELSIAYSMPQGAESRITATAKLSSGFKYGMLGLDSSVQNKLTYMFGADRMTNVGDASITAYLSGQGWILRPSLTVTASYSLETKKYIGTEGTYKAGARFLISSSKPFTNQASLGYAYSSSLGGRHEVSASDSLSFTALGGNMGIGAGINASASLNPTALGMSSYKATVNGSISYKFDKSWSARLEGEVGLGSSAFTEAPKPVYGFQLTVTLRF